DEIGQPGSGSGEELVNNRFTIDETDEEQMVVFSLASEQYGIRINQVQEINRLSKITKVPRAPHYVEGVVNLRGEVIPVIDLRKRFELESNEHNQFTRIIVSDIHNKKVGIIVDAVLEVLRVGKTRIESPPDICETQGSERFLDGIANLQERMIMMINLENLLQDKEWKKLEKISQTGNQAAPSSGAKLNKQR
ncbi:MAG: chemotaxis protein CheW, partial [Syntrophomonas sp.]